jgi:hypothetical protein
LVALAWSIISHCPDVRRHRGRPEQSRRHRREAARRDHTHVGVAGHLIELDILVGGQAAEAERYVRPGAHRSPDVLLDRCGAGVLDEHVDRGTASSASATGAVDHSRTPRELTTFSRLFRAAALDAPALSVDWSAPSIVARIGSNRPSR